MVEKWFGYTLIFGAIASPIVSAFYWDKIRGLRPLPIMYGVVAGLLFAFWGQDDHSFLKILEIVSGCSFAGLIFYFAVWVQCKK